MATYIVLGQYTDQGIRNIKETTKRSEALKEMAKRVGATVKEVYWTLGQYDIATVVEAPDDASVTALLLSVGALGNVRTQCAAGFFQRRDEPDSGQIGVDRANHKDSKTPRNPRRGGFQVCTAR